MLILANRLDGGLDDSLSPHSTVVRPHVSDVSPQLMSSPYCSLPVRFDRTFFKNIFGDHFLPFATIPKDSTLGISFCLFALSPRFSPTGQTSQSRSISLGIKF